MLIELEYHRNILKKLLLGLSFAALAAYGQSEIGSATLNGTVMDPSGAAVPAAKVTVKQPATGLTRSTETTGAGLYSFSSLPVGTYDVSVDKVGFSSAKAEMVGLAVGAASTLDFRLQVGSNAETVSVTSEAPVVETARSQTSTTVDSKAVGSLPINGRNFIDFTLLTPGVVRDVRGTGDLSFGGQRGPQNSLLVDGADANNLFYAQAAGRTGFRPSTFSLESVQEFQVSANNFPAEIGRAGGGVINAVTKSGTNAFHGQAFDFYRDRDMNANTFVNNRSGLPRGAYHFNQFGANVGGPIKKDTLFFFDYSGQRNKSNQSIVPNITPTGAALTALAKYLTPYQVGANNDTYLIKTDWNIGQNDRLSVRLNFSRYTGNNLESNGLTSALEHTGDNKVNTNNVAAAYTHLFGPTMVWESRFNYAADDEPGEANTDGVEVVIVNGVTFGKNNFSPRYTNSFSYQPVNTLSWVKGRHSLKFGFDLNISKIDNYFPGLFAGSYTFPSYAAFLAQTPSQYSQAFSGSGTTVPVSHPNTNEYAFFAQDSFRVNDQLTLNYGVRYDYFAYAQNATTHNTDPGLAALGYKTDGIPTDKADFGPRIGVAYRPIKSNNSLVLRGGYGIYYSRTPGLLLSTAILQNGIDVITYNLTSNLPTYPSILPKAPGAAAPASIYVMQNDFKSPRTQQYTMQIETQVGRGASLTVGYLGVHSDHLSRSRDINLLPSVLSTGNLPDGTPIAYYRHPGVGSPTRPDPTFARITLFDSQAVSTYNGGFIQFTRRFSQNFQVLASYTLSKVIDTAPDGTSVVPGNGGDDAKVANDTLNPDAEKGPGVNDIRNRFVFSGVWDIRYGNKTSNKIVKAIFGDYQLSVISQIQSGKRFSVTTSGDPGNDTNNNNDRAPLYGRNTLVGPNFMAADLRLTKTIHVGEKVGVQLMGEAFNFTNRANFTALQTNLYTYNKATNIFTPTTNFLLPQATADPRILQLGARVTF
jgi:Carboxypeptidase regulatory-like domain/TonB dependent receptor